MNQALRLLLEIGPLVVFFVANGRYGIFYATAAFMVVTPFALATMWLLERKLPVMPLVSGLFIIALGGLTLALQDDTFIKLKPTIVNLLFATILGVGLSVQRPFLKTLFGSVMNLDPQGWKILTIRWIAFFVVLAILNELVWRTQTTEFWIQFKLLGIMPLTLAFSVAQLPLINRHMSSSNEDTGKN